MTARIAVAEYALGLCLSVIASAGMAAGTAERTPGCNPDGNQAEMNACAAEDFEKADAALNATWKTLLARLGSDSLGLVRAREAQLQWIRFRDAELAAHFPLAAGEDSRVKYGSMHPLEHYSLLAKLTRQRESQLREWLDELDAR